MPIRTASYDNFETRLAGMLGEPNLLSISASLINGWFNKRMKYIWEYAEWIEICPTEQRPAGLNLAKGKNDISDSAWTANGVEQGVDSLNTDEVQDPWWGYLADKLLETSADGVHRLEQSISHASDYTMVEVYFRAGLTRKWGYISSNGDDAPIGYFNFEDGETGTSENVEDATIIEANNGWYRCRLQHTAPYPGNTYYVGLADDDESPSYTGNGNNGAYVAGFRVYDSTVPLIPYLEEDLTPIGDFFDVSADDPYSYFESRGLELELIRDGAIYRSRYGGGYGGYGGYGYHGSRGSVRFGSIIDTCDPYVKYRKRVPFYNGPDYNSSTNYVIDNQVYHSGSGRFYRAKIDSLGISPPDTIYWEELEIPNLFFEYVISGVFADWLKQNGQHGKAVAEEQSANLLLLRELDLLERQQRQKPNVHVSTHLSAQLR